MSEKSQKKDSPATHPAVGYVSKPFDFSYNFKDVIVYNLGVGASIKDSHGLQYLYEGHHKFGPIPSFAVIPQFAGKQRICFCQYVYLIFMKEWRRSSLGRFLVLILT